MVNALKRALKEQGLTYKQLAPRLALSEASVKRLFASGRFSLSLIEKAADELGLSLFDLMAQARLHRDGATYRLTLEQEQELASDPRFYFFFWFVLGRIPLNKIITHFRLKEADVQRYLLKLDRLGIIALREKNHYTVLVPLNIVLNEGGPIEREVIARVLPKFLEGPFKGPLDYSRNFVVRASAESIMKYKTKIRQLAEEMFRDLLTEESTLEHTKVFGVVIALGELQFSLEEAIRGKKG